MNSRIPLQPEIVPRALERFLLTAGKLIIDRAELEQSGMRNIYAYRSDDDYTYRGEGVNLGGVSVNHSLTALLAASRRISQRTCARSFPVGPWG
jgi:hypothetical protein